MNLTNRVSRLGKVPYPRRSFEHELTTRQRPRRSLEIPHGRRPRTDATCIAAALDANTEATLALAFEQRTANLIAQLSMRLAALGKDVELQGEVMNELNARLGLNGDTK